MREKKMRKSLQSVSPRLGLWRWWAVSAVALLALSLVIRAVVRQPPFTDMVYMVGYSLVFPALLIGVLRLMAWLRRGVCP